MSAQFIPFLQSMQARLPQRASSQGTGFIPVATPSVPEKPAVASGSCGEVKVELKRDGDRIQEIRIHCKCGEVIELLCDY